MCASHNAYYVKCDRSRHACVTGVWMLRYGARMASNATIPGGSDDHAGEGGGTPNPGAEIPMGAQKSPASNFPTVSPLREILDPAVPEAEDDGFEYPLTWTGEPRKSTLRRLMREAWVPAFDVERAAEVIEAVWEGNTLKRALELAGLRRSVVKAWAVLVPKFGELLAEAQTGLGEWYRDCAAEQENPALMTAQLRLAASFDARIKGGDGAAESSLVVQVVKLGGGSGSG